MDLSHIPVGESPPHEVNVIIEIPQGGAPVKYEVDKASGAMFVDRFLHTKARLTTLIKGGNVACEARDKDRFGRIVAVCSAQDVPDLGEAMVRQGYAMS